MALRSQHFLVDREPMLDKHREQLKPDLIWNIEKGQKQPASRLAWAERERAALYRRFHEFFQRWDLLVSPCAATPAFDVELRHPKTVDGNEQTTT